MKSWIIAGVLTFVFALKNSGNTISGINLVSEKTRSWETEAKIAQGRYGIPADLILAVIQKESSGRMDAPHSTGEFGLMGITPEAAADFGYGVVPSDPQEHIILGTRILADRINKMGNVFDGLRAYNAGTTGATNYPNRSVDYANKVLAIKAQI